MHEIGQYQCERGWTYNTSWAVYEHLEEDGIGGDLDDSDARLGQEDTKMRALALRQLGWHYLTTPPQGSLGWSRTECSLASSIQHF